MRARGLPTAGVAVAGRVDEGRGPRVGRVAGRDAAGREAVVRAVFFAAAFFAGAFEAAFFAVFFTWVGWN